MGHAVTQLVEALRYKSEGLGFAAVQTDGVRVGDCERVMGTDGNVPYWTRSVLCYVGTEFAYSVRM